MAGNLIARMPKWVTRLALALAAGLIVLVLPVGSVRASNAVSEGLVCTTSPTEAFVLTTQTGYILTPDGNSLYMWGFSNGNGAFQYPGPNLCVNQGDKVTITFKNTLPVASSIMFPGLQGVSVDGAPTKPDFTKNSLTQAVPAGSSATYTFTPSNSGTYLYESGTDPELQERMGMVGALIVHPRGPVPVGSPPNTQGPVLADHAYAESWTQYDTAHEYVHVLSEVDPDMHAAVEKAVADMPTTHVAPSYDLTKYHAHYYFVNGRSFPDTISPNFAQHLPSQPYGALVHVTPNGGSAPPALVRYLNAGPVTYPFHPHSNHEKQIGVDGRVLQNLTAGAGGTPVDTSIDRFGVVVAPGETLETQFVWTDAQGWNADTNPVDVLIPKQGNVFEGPYWSGSPYLGVKNSLQDETTQYNLCGEYYHVAHSHALNQSTNYGQFMGGMLTMIRVDPPNKQAACASPGY